jgi:ribosomal protein S27AE
MATKTADKFKCPNCGSGRTRPISVAIASGTRRRTTVGLSRRSIWSSSSTYKSDLVSSLPHRPSNAGAYLLMFLGAFGLLFALLIGSADKNTTGFAVLVGIVAFLFLFGGIGARKKPEELIVEQASWDNRWMCARCGNQWEAN